MKKTKILMISFIGILCIFIIYCFTTSIIYNNAPKNITLKVLTYLSEDNNEKLEDLFCEQIRNSEDFDIQIQTAMDFFNGKIVTYDSINRISWTTNTIEKGKITKLTAGPYVENIVTDKNTVYSIKFYINIVDINNPEKVGISKLIIKEQSNKEIIVGKYIE